MFQNEYYDSNSFFCCRLTKLIPKKIEDKEATASTCIVCELIIL